MRIPNSTTTEEVKAQIEALKEIMKEYETGNFLVYCPLCRLTIHCGACYWYWFYDKMCVDWAMMKSNRKRFDGESFPISNLQEKTKLRLYRMKIIPKHIKQLEQWIKEK